MKTYQSLEAISLAQRQAIDRGIQHLKSLQNIDGSWPANRVGATALVGLTLLSLQGLPDTVARTARPGRTQQLSYRAPHSGWYAVKLRITRHGGGRYALHLTKSG